MSQANQPFDFFWVNEDAESASQSRHQSETTRAINRQAQLGRVRSNTSRRRWSLQVEALSTRSVAHINCAIQPRPAKGDATLDIEVVPLERSDPKLVGYAAPLAKSPSGSLQAASAQLLNVDDINPFNSTEFAVNCNIYRLLRYHLSHSIIFTVNKDVLNAGPASKRHRYFLVLRNLVHNCLSSETHMYALLSATAGRMTLVSGSHEEHASYFMQNATKLMRRYFLSSNPAIDTQTITDITFLCVSELCRGDHSAALVHLQVLAQLIHVLDLTKSVDRYLFGSFVCLDVYISIETGTIPIFPPCWQPRKLLPYQISKLSSDLDQLLSQLQDRPLWDPLIIMTDEDKLAGITAGPFVFLGQRPASKGYHFKYEASRLLQRPGQGITEALDKMILGPSTKDLATDLTTHLEASAYSSMCSDLDCRGIRAMGKRTISLLHRFLSVHTTSTPAVDNCFRLAVIIMLSYVSNPIAWRSNRMVASQLQQAILVLEVRDSAPISCGLSVRMLLWILIVGMFAAAEPPLSEWFLDRALTLALKIGLRNYADLQHLMERYIHFETAQNACLSNLAARIALKEPYSISLEYIRA